MSDKFSYLSNANPEYIDNLYQQYQQDPASVSAEWARFFEGFDFAITRYGEEGEGEGDSYAIEERKVLNLIYGYRIRGHFFTHTNPVRERRTYEPTLDVENFGLTKADLDKVFQAGSEVGLGPAKLSDIIRVMEQTYCQSIGAEYQYVRDPHTLKWLEDKIEENWNTPNFSIEKKKSILRKLNQAVAFEKFLGTKFVGQKRFSLEGGETLIPALDAVIEKGSSLGIEEFVIGMAHRGRLNVLANTLHKEYDEIFSEFAGKERAASLFQGDVKYHMGFSSDVTTNEGKKVHLSLMPNPSHLEAVDPVVQGVSRAKIDRKYGGDFSRLAPILIHGDAAISGQGIVYEVIQYSLLEGYRAGGTVHIVINNQIGFTTNYIDGRSSTYCTDVAKITLSPVFHVNGDDVEALVHAVELAMEFRQTFKKDVFIDLLCYRRHGHNESDEPSFTQPLLYKTIKSHPDPFKIYVEKLKEAGEIEAEMAKEVEKEFKALLQKELQESNQAQTLRDSEYLKDVWTGIRRCTKEDFDKPSPKTGVSKRKLLSLVRKMHEIPESFKAHKKINKLFGDRMKMVDEDRLDWALGELLAYATLLDEGHTVRLSGQDVERGTFSHRHSVLRSTDSEEEYIPLNHLNDKQEAKFDVYNSSLSEYGVLGFEYGYSLSSPNGLVIWEAQFGDFANGAQIMMDQYISSGETKWQRMSGLVQLLPHGYEGQGPEHSSARIERYLQLCARKNMQILNCTTPASIFHALRRQLHRPFRMPLIIFTPKKLLRYPKAVSTISDLSTGGFQELIDDSYAKASKVKRVLCCSGKIYYDLLEKQQTDKRDDVAIVRLEQLYPLPAVQLEAMYNKYSANGADFYWVQEEPRNMGPWSYIHRVIEPIDFKLISRKPSATPATGYPRQHKSQQTYIIEASFSKVPEKVSV